MNIILSIHPKWAKLIYEGKKTIEWRKTLPKNDYPLHPGQTHIPPYYCTIPLEEYEGLKKKIRSLENELATTNAMLEQRNADVTRLTEEREGLVSEMDNIDSRR